MKSAGTPSTGSALTPEEISTVSVARVASSSETDALLAIIERLTGPLPPAADERTE